MLRWVIIMSTGIQPRWHQTIISSTYICYAKYLRLIPIALHQSATCKLNIYSVKHRWNHSSNHLSNGHSPCNFAPSSTVHFILNVMELTNDTKLSVPLKVQTCFVKMLQKSPPRFGLFYVIINHLLHHRSWWLNWIGLYCYLHYSVFIGIFRNQQTLMVCSDRD